VGRNEKLARHFHGEGVHSCVIHHGAKPKPRSRGIRKAGTVANSNEVFFRLVKTKYQAFCSF